MTGLSWEDDGAGESLMTRRSVQQCLSSKEIEDFLFDRLSGVTREVIEEHLLVCHKCLDRVEEEEKYFGAVRKAAARIQQEEFTAAVAGKPPVPGKLREWFGKFFGKGPAVWATVGLAGVLATVVLVQRQPGAKTEVEVALRLERGGAPEEPAAAAGRTMILTVDIQELPDAPVYRLDVVDGAGRLMASGEVAPQTGRLRWKVPRVLAAGAYWVRLRNPEEPLELLREYGLVVR
ncbi:MAG: hypothetical protein HY858_11775 [Candidatus Solibacter usitatus]|nr:hypothetical protein [Candidatus Solibacter usitatus]